MLTATLIIAYQRPCLNFGQASVSTGFVSPGGDFLRTITGCSWVACRILYLIFMLSCTSNDLHGDFKEAASLWYWYKLTGGHANDDKSAAAKHSFRGVCSRKKAQATIRCHVCPCGICCTSGVIIFMHCLLVFLHPFSHHIMVCCALQDRMRQGDWCRWCKQCKQDCLNYPCSVISFTIWGPNVHGARVIDGGIWLILLCLS